MKKDKIILVVLLFLLFLISSTLIITSFKKEEVIEHVYTDSEKIKEIYEKQNGTLVEVSLPIDNVFKKIADENIINEINENTGLIYFGNPINELDRKTISLVNELADKKNISKINYIDIETICAKLDIDDLGNKIVKENGSKNYYKLLDLLDKYLENYILTDKDGKKVKLDEKQITSPTIISYKDGKIVKVYVVKENAKNLKEDLIAILESVKEKASCNKEEAC